ncbi:9348_t:CDS:1, partial [Funneliformis geosporum]
NVDKLNEALKVVDMIQHLMINAGQLHNSRRIPVAMLEKPKDFYDIEEESPPQQSQF